MQDPIFPEWMWWLGEHHSFSEGEGEGRERGAQEAAAGLGRKASECPAWSVPQGLSMAVAAEAWRLLRAFLAPRPLPLPRTSALSVDCPSLLQGVSLPQAPWHLTPGAFSHL